MVLIMTTNKMTDDVLIQSTEPDQSMEYLENYLQEKQAALAALGETPDAQEKAALQPWTPCLGQSVTC